ncbi:MAG TPA: DUF4215 domain-containing protein, partial [Kofleriaceae bacterium]|nr:DUF4215 domain-containing protein [Kofleriaceae bacterium]
MKTLVDMKYVGVLVGCVGVVLAAGCSEPAKITPTCDQAQALVGCDIEACVDGELTSTPAEAGTVCAIDNGHVCDGASHCVECLQGADCATGVCNDNMCGAPLCGDGVVSANEACDDGNIVSGDGCEADCAVTGCGNGVVAGAEACDDGNTRDGDGCSAACEFEACPATGPSSQPCDVGNGFVRRNDGYQAKNAEIQIDTSVDVTIRIGRRDLATAATQLALHTAMVSRGGVTLSDTAPTVAERSDRLVITHRQASAWLAIFWGVHQFFEVNFSQSLQTVFIGFGNVELEQHAAQAVTKRNRRVRSGIHTTSDTDFDLTQSDFVGNQEC